MDTSALTSGFAAYFAALTLGDIPADVQGLGRLLLLDTVGCMTAGAQAAPAQQIRTVGRLFGGAGQASEVGNHELQGVARAAYVNARVANLLDFDETYPVGVHFGVGAVAAALAGVQASNGTLSELLCAAIAGYEAGARMASAIGPMMSVENGEVTGFSRVWGVAAPVVLAATVAYSKALRLDQRTLHQAIAIAGSNIPLPIGSKWSDATDLPDVKYCDAGWCTMAGIHGVESAMAGLTGFENILEGDSAIPQAYSASMPDPSKLHDELGQRWHLRDITIKPWPCCRFMHPPMSALNRLLRQQQVQPEEIEELVIYTGPLANSSRFRNPQPRTFASFQFSYAHACSMLAMNIEAGHRWFDTALSGSEMARGIRDKVRIELYEPSLVFARHMKHNQIRQMPGAAKVVTRRGTWELASDFADGDPWSQANKYEWKDVVGKFITANPSDRSRGLCDWLETAAPAESIDRLTTFIQGN